MRIRCGVLCFVVLCCMWLCCDSGVVCCDVPCVIVRCYGMLGVVVFYYGMFDRNIRRYVHACIVLLICYRLLLADM